MLRKLFKSRKRVAGASIATAIGVSALIVLATAPAAGAATVYNNIPDALPGNVPSEAFEAQSASEFGGQVAFDGAARHNPRLTATMSSWGCQSGGLGTHDCSTSPGAKFSLPIRFNVYRVGNNDEPGRLVGAVTHTYAIPYRPSANFTKCTGDDAGKWYSIRDASCKSGKVVRITGSLGSLDLPEKAIISVEYNTTHYGYEPIGDAPCVSTSGGCPYDSLNVGVGDGDTSTPLGEPTVGSQPTPDDAYLNSSWDGAYCDGSLGTGTFRLDAGCWTGYQPLFKVTANG